MRSASLKAIAIGFLFLASAGCIPMRFSQYTGQNVDWPRSTGTMAETRFAVPVYRGWPSQRYRIIGSIRHEDPNAHWDDGDISAAASRAKSQGADAIIIRLGGEFGVSKLIGAQSDPLVIGSSQTTALVIKWLSQEEISAREQTEKGALDWYNATHPNLQANEDIAGIATLYLRQNGFDLRSVSGKEKFAETLQLLVAPPGNELSGTWIFKGTISSSSLTSAGNDSLLGLATVNVNGDVIAIVSKTGTQELNFSGTYSKGRLEGHLGIAGHSVKSDGAAVVDKISLSFQSTTPDGVISGSVVLQRMLRKLNSQP